MNDLLVVIKRLATNGLGVPLMMMLMLAMMVVPLPPLLLDVLFTFNIALALIVLLVSIYAIKPLSFSVFPVVLLLTTLLRLGLNIASTRVILLNGQNGTDAAGKVIQAFGEFVVGGNYAVGIVVFAILVVINFVVVTKGAGRISEVTARFTLDSMPGKQMAIDADLNAGQITHEQANERRKEVVREADFYGSMDGASKFVRGDAVAGIIIMLVCVIGGLAIGVFQHNMPLGQALQNYTLLTIGDGLVAQIPALVLSTAAGIIVTRASTSEELGEQIVSQLLGDPRALGTTAVVIGIMGLIPGMPNLAFLTLAAVAGAAAYYQAKKKRAVAAAPAIEAAVPKPVPENKELSWDDVQAVDLLGLEVGYRLIPLVDKNQGGQLMARIKGVRKKNSQDLGFLVPAVHIRDNLDLAPTAYRITLMGVIAGEAEIYPEREMAINPGQVFGQLQGVKTKDPAFGLEAVWIDPTQREHAQGLGYTVVDASTVVATHLSQIVQDHAHELLGREEVQQLVDKLTKVAPKLAEELVPKALPLGVLVKVFQNLLEEKIPLRDVRSIAETLADHAPRSQDPGVLTAAVRAALGRSIVQQINGLGAELAVMTLEPSLEQLLQKSTQSSAEEWSGFEPGLAERLHRALRAQAQRQEIAGQPAVLLVSASLRTLLARFVRHTIPGLRVLSFNEVPDDKQIKVIATVGGTA
jgi:flagellar biosynthesis protein FlhA